MKKWFLVIGLFLCGCATPADKIPSETLYRYLPPGAILVKKYGNTNNLWVEFSTQDEKEIRWFLMHICEGAGRESLVLLKREKVLAERKTEEIPINES